MTLLCLVWSLQQISLKAVADQASPMLMVAMRSAIALALLAVLMRHRGEVPVRGAGRRGLPSARCSRGVPAGGRGAAPDRRLACRGVPLHGADLRGLGAALRLPAERLGIVQGGGIAVAFGGIAWHSWAAKALTVGTDARVLLGDALALMAGAAWGATTVAIRCSALASAPATETLFYQLLGAFVLLLPAAWLTGQWHFEPSALVWAHLGFQSLIVSFASFLAWCWLLRRYLASQLGVFSFLTPLFGVVLGVWLLGESLQPQFIAGSGFVLAGIGMVSGHAALSRRLVALRRLAQAAS